MAPVEYDNLDSNGNHMRTRDGKNCPRSGNISINLYNEKILCPTHYFQSKSNNQFCRWCFRDGFALAIDICTAAAAPVNEIAYRHVRGISTTAPIIYYNIVSNCISFFQFFASCFLLHLDKRIFVQCL